MPTFTRIVAYGLPMLLVPVLASAAQLGCSNGTGLSNPICTTDLTTFLAKLLELVALIAFPIIVLFMVYIGFLFVTSQGNPEKIKEAREYFVWAIVGALLILGAEALSLAIKATVGEL